MPQTRLRLLRLGYLVSFLCVLHSASAGDAPTISLHPQSLALIASEDTQFSVTASGTEPLSYQWRFNHEDIAGATAATYPLNYVQSQNVGGYEVVVTNATGSVTSEVATLTVDYPRVRLEPADGWVSIAEGGVGGNVQFSVAPLPHPPVAYQWQFNGVNIPGQTGSNLTLNVLGVTNGGNYSVWVQTTNGGTAGPARSLQVFPVKVAREQWRTNAATPGNIVKMLTDDAGNIYFAVNYHVAGFNVVKLNPGGQVLYNENFKRPPCNCDEAADLALDGEGNLYVVGNTSLNLSGTAQGYLTVKYDASGSNVWFSIYNVGLGSSLARGVVPDGAGNVYVVGGSTGTNTTYPYDCVTVKYDCAGNLLWQRRFDSGGHDYGYGIALDLETNVVVAGESGGSGQPWGSLAIKYDKDGNQLWRNPDSFGEGRKVLLGTNNNPFVASAQGVIAQLNQTNGASIGDSAMGGILLCFATDGHGRMFAVGNSGGSDSRMIVHSIMQDGTGEWNDSFPGYAYAGAVDRRGNVYVVGRPPGYSSQCRIVKWNCDGWRAWVLDPPGLTTTALGVCVDKQSNLTVAISGTSGTVVSYDQPHRLQPLGFQSDGSLRLVLTGEPRVPVWLKGSTNLWDWLNLSTLQFSVSTADFTDMEAAAIPYRFYRTESIVPP